MTPNDERPEGRSNAPRPDQSIVLERVEALVGLLSHGQRDRVLSALDDDQAGVLALAQRLSGSPEVRSPAAVLIAAIARGAHRGKASAPLERLDGSPEPGIPLRRLYFARLAYLDRLGWRTVGHRQRDALDYACSYLPTCRQGPMPAGGIIALERELCDELGIDPQALPLP